MSNVLQSDGSGDGSSMSLSLSDFPQELILHIASFLASVEDLHYLSCSSKQLQRYLSAISPNTILRLAARSRTDFFRPRSGLENRQPYLIIAATARQLSEWAVKSPENVAALQKAFQGGLYPLIFTGCDSDDEDNEYGYWETGNVLELCLEHCSLTMDDIRRLHAYKRTTIDPVIDLIDKLCGKQWRATWDDEADPPSDKEEMASNATETFYNLAVYGSLFACCFTSTLDPRQPRNGLDTAARLDYLKYCVPDDNCWATQHRPTDAPRGPDGRLHPWLAVAYEPIYSATEFITDMTEPHIVMRHLLRGRGWRQVWAAVRGAAGGDFGEAWRQRLWEAVVMFQGFEGMEMIGSEGPARWKGRLVEWRARIEALREQPKVTTVGQSWSLKVYVPEYPMLADELRICTFGYYGYHENQNGF